MLLSPDIGLHFIIEPEGTELTSEEARKLALLKPAGVMFRKRNFIQDAPYDVWLPAYRNLVRQITDITERDTIIISIDHEGGRVVRPPEPVTRFPYAAHWGERAAGVGEAMGIELRSLGINVSFAPVADIASNPENPVINERAFGRTVDEVERGVLPFAKALEGEQVKACAKHFPGHGDTTTDSHWSLPVLSHTLDEMRNRELLPFKALIDWGIQAIMTAHVVFPALDKNNPATLSPMLLTKILREELQFNGVTIADALGMEAIRPLLSDKETSARAISAGLDIFLVVGDSVNLDDALFLAKSLEEKSRGNRALLKSMSESQARVNSFLESLSRNKVTRLSDQLFEKHAALAAELAQKDAWGGTFALNLPGFE